MASLAMSSRKEFDSLTAKPVPPFPMEDCRAGNHEAVHAWKRSKGGDINAQFRFEEWTPLQLACAEGDDTAVDVLLKAGADPNSYLGGRTRAAHSPLHIAARYGHDGVVRRLIDAGARVSEADAHGFTPAHLAAASGHARVVEALLAGGADVAAKSNNGATPFALAKAAKLRDVEAALERATIAQTEGSKARERLRAWLAKLGGEKFLPDFVLKGYDDIDFLAENGLNEADLDKIGVDGPPGLRKKLLGKWKISEYATGADEEEEEEEEEDEDDDDDGDDDEEEDDED